jgi:hypothetical protein
MQCVRGLEIVFVDDNVRLRAAVDGARASGESGGELS